MHELWALECRCVRGTVLVITLQRSPSELLKQLLGALKTSSVWGGTQGLSYANDK